VCEEDGGWGGGDAEYEGSVVLRRRWVE